MTRERKWRPRDLGWCPDKILKTRTEMCALSSSLDASGSQQNGEPIHFWSWSSDVGGQFLAPEVVAAVKR